PLPLGGRSHDEVPRRAPSVRYAAPFRQSRVLERIARPRVGRIEAPMRRAYHAAAFASVLSGCGSAAHDPGSAALTKDELDALAALATPSPDALPAPGPDKSNLLADDARAAALGQKLFFETAFSGKLEDGDDDGSPSTLGVRGQTGRVACAGCHVPAAGFVDN